jgi:uncharacterized protein
VQLEHSFTVPAEVDIVWQAVLDPERVAPCMPGATLTEVSGSNFSGTVKVKLGPISLLYKGSGEFLEADEQARKVVIKASGKDARGNGTASATVTVVLSAADGGTAGTVHTDLSITGKPAQFGRGMISEVGGKILNAFAGCLATKLAPQEEDPAPSAVDTAGAGSDPQSAAAASASAAVATQAKPKVEAKPQPQPEPEAEPIDLLEYAGPSVLKRAMPLIAVAVAVIAILLRRRRSR